MPERIVRFHDRTCGKPANQIDQGIDAASRANHLIHETPDVGLIGDIRLHVRATFHMNRSWMLVDHDDPGTCRDEGRNNRLS